MRGETLANVRIMVKKESRLSSATSRTTDNDEYIDQLIKRYQEQLYDDFDWPFMRLWKEDSRKDMFAGERYYDFPTNINLERTVVGWRKYSNVWTEVPQGITMSDYSSFDSDDDERADPILKWDVRDEDQFEVWPMPAADDVQVFAFDGYRKLTPLVDDESRLDLDDIMVALFASAEVLAGKNQKDAQLKLAAARLRYQRITGRLATKTRIGFYGGSFGCGDNRLRIRVPLVRS